MIIKSIARVFCWETVVTVVVTAVLEDFLRPARRFLEEVCAPRTPVRSSGAKSHYALFSGATAAEIEAAMAHQRAAFDAGCGWISGPQEFGGAGLPAQYERAFAAVEREYAIPSKGPLSVSLGMVAPTLAQFGSDEAKGRWLKALRRGDGGRGPFFSET